MSNKKVRRRRQREQRWFEIFNQTMTLTDEDILMSIARGEKLRVCGMTKPVTLR